MSPSIRRVVQFMVAATIETVYPKVCAGCGMRGTWLCQYCVSTVPVAAQPISCLRCGVPALGKRCACSDLDPLITRCRSAFVYDGWTATAVKALKYHGEWARAEHLAPFMVSELEAFAPITGLIPVPLHPSREKSRGYNQAAILAERLKLITGIPVLKVLERTRKTSSQTSLSGVERARNVSGCFRLIDSWAPPPGGRYVLIDDVRTTGATLNACAEALHTAQPAMVGVLTFALDLSREQREAMQHYHDAQSLQVKIDPGGSAPSPSAPIGRP